MCVQRWQRLLCVCACVPVCALSDTVTRDTLLMHEQKNENTLGRFRSKFETVLGYTDIFEAAPMTVVIRLRLIFTSSTMVMLIQICNLSNI